MSTPLPRYIVDISPEAAAKIAAAAQGRGPAGAPGGSRQSENEKQVNVLREGFRRVESAVSRVGLAGLGGVTALAAKGFQNTYAGARLGYETDRLSRQLAAVFQPVVQAMTYLSAKLADGLGRIDLQAQNRLMNGVLGATAGLFLGGPRAALVGGVLGTIAGPGSGSGRNDALLGAAAGAYAGFRVGGAAGALIGGAAGAALAGPRDRLDAALTGGLAGAGLGLLLGGPLGLLIGGAAGAAGGALLGPDPGDGLAAVAGRGPRREAPVPFSAAEEEAGGAARRFQEVIARMNPDGTLTEDAGPLKPIVDALLTIIELLAKIAGVTVAFDSPAAPRT